jgi:hypothetical protein|tara:strand:- start:1319 stop:1432 length:114 start_codon:yes stop_codon:yes gene_type:complete
MLLKWLKTPRDWKVFIGDTLGMVAIFGMGYAALVVFT